MPKAFEKARAKPGTRVRTVTKGKNKGKLIAITKGGKSVVGYKRGHKK